jgi:Mg2+ and Co2+ transporter CorA
MGADFTALIVLLWEENMSEEQDFLIAALKESNDMLRELHDRHRRTIQFLRAVNSSLRQRLARAHQSDEEFKEFCADQTNIVIDIETNVVESEGGLPEDRPSQTQSLESGQGVSNSRD